MGLHPQLGEAARAKGGPTRHASRENRGNQPIYVYSPIDLVRLRLGGAPRVTRQVIETSLYGCQALRDSVIPSEEGLSKKKTPTFGDLAHSMNRRRIGEWSTLVSVPVAGCAALRGHPGWGLVTLLVAGGALALIKLSEKYLESRYYPQIVASDHFPTGEAHQQAEVWAVATLKGALEARKQGMTFSQKWGAVDFNRHEQRWITAALDKLSARVCSRGDGSSQSNARRRRGRRRR